MALLWFFDLFFWRWAQSLNIPVVLVISCFGLQGMCTMCCAHSANPCHMDSARGTQIQFSTNSIFFFFSPFSCLFSFSCVRSFHALQWFLSELAGLQQSRTVTPRFVQVHLTTQIHEEQLEPHHKTFCNARSIESWSRAWGWEGMWTRLRKKISPSLANCEKQMFSELVSSQRIHNGSLRIQAQLAHPVRDEECTRAWILIWILDTSRNPENDVARILNQKIVSSNHNVPWKKMGSCWFWSEWKKTHVGMTGYAWALHIEEGTNRLSPCSKNEKVIKTKAATNRTTTTFRFVCMFVTQFSKQDANNNNKLPKRFVMQRISVCDPMKRARFSEKIREVFWGGTWSENLNDFNDFLQEPDFGEQSRIWACAIWEGIVWRALRDESVWFTTEGNTEFNLLLFHLEHPQTSKKYTHLSDKWIRIGTLRYINAKWGVFVRHCSSNV